MTVVYDTALQEPRDRFRFWSGLMCRTFAPAHGVFPRGSALDARFTVNELGPTTICTVSAPRQLWERTKRHIRDAPREQFLFSQLISGNGVLRQRGQELRLQAGAMAIYDVNLPYTYEVEGEVLFVKLPKRELIRQVGLPRELGIPAQRHRGLPDWTSGVVRQAAGLEIHGDPRTANLVGGSVMGAIMTLLRDAAPITKQDHSNICSPTLQRVCADIEAQLSDPDLSVDGIARAHGMSERSLYRLFEDLGTTPTRWILRQRLERCHSQLQSQPHRSVSDIAICNGFSDLSHFSRSFKKAYTIAPTASRKTQGLNPQ